MELTDEQQAIVDATDHIIIAEAVAGSGKSSTAIEFAKARPDKKILYLVFNKSLQEESKKLFKGMDNVDVLTNHGLAYRSVGYKYKNKLLTSGSYSAKDLNDDLDLQDYSHANTLNYHWGRYLLSDYITIKDYCNEHIKNKKTYNDTLFYLEKLYKLKANPMNDVKVEHNFYLKEFFMSGFDTVNEYDVLILDEFQDSNYVMQYIFTNSKCKQKLALGDSAQSINSFAGAINALENIEGTRYPMSQSFRIGSLNSTICNMLFEEYTNDDKFCIVGVNDSQKTYPFSPAIQPQDFDRCAIISRTNAVVLANAIEMSKIGKYLYFVGGIEGYKLDFYLKMWYFACGYEQKDDTFKKYKNYKDLVEYAEEAEDVELLTAINVIKRYNKNIPDYVKKIKEYTVKKEKDANVILSNAHKFKGGTVTVPLFIANDFINPEELDWQRQGMNWNNAPEEQKNRFYKETKEEINLLYVALTRAKSDLYLSPDVTKYCIKKGLFK